MQRRLLLLPIGALAATLLITALGVPVLASETVAGATGNYRVPEFEYEPVPLSCSGGFSYAVYPADDLDTEIDTEIQVDELEGLVRFRVPSLEGGQYTFERSCPEVEGEQRDSEAVLFAYSRVLVTTSVAGDVPADTSFIVNVVCTEVDDGGGHYPPDPLVDTDREFGADGGDAQVVFYRTESRTFGGIVECTVTEPEDGGAESVTIEPEAPIQYTEFTDGSSTVTNTFPPPQPSPSPMVDNAVDEAEPAEPVEVEPDFTG